MGGQGLHLAILFVFAIGWVINQIATKEEKPNPSIRRPPAPPSGRDAALRFGQTESTADPRRPANRSSVAVSDDLLIIRSDSTTRPGARPPQARQQTPPRTQPSPPIGKRPARPRPGTGTPARRPEPPVSKSKSLSSGMPTQALERPSGGLPSMTAVAAAASQASRATQATSIAPVINITAAPPLPITLAVTASLSDRDRMREAFILSELLTVPKALKHRRSFR